MAESGCDGDAPFFLGHLDHLKAFSRWFDDFERAAVCRIDGGDDENGNAPFVVDLRALNKTLSVAHERLGCLNPVDAQKFRSLVGELQRDVAALLAGGLDAFLEPSEDVQQLDLQLRQTIQKATPYFRWLGTRTRDELACIKREPTEPKATETTGKATGGEPAEPPGNSSNPTKPKRSTERGEGQAKLISALTKHHKYADGACLHQEPIGNNELARLAGVSDSTASAFFNKQFNGHVKYRAICADVTSLLAALKLLNQEFSPHHLFGAKPPDEREAEE